MKKGIAFAGTLLVDKLLCIDTWPQPGTYTKINSETQSMGGLVSNCAIDLAKLDSTMPVKALGYLGEDEFGAYALAELAKYPSIDTSHIWREQTTAYTLVMTTNNGERTFIGDPGDATYFAPSHFDFDQLECDILHIGYLLILGDLDEPDADYPTGLCRVLADAKAHGIATSIDVVSAASVRFASVVVPALAYTDYCIVNEIEAGHCTEMLLRDADGQLLMDNFEPCLKRLAELGVGRWIVIHTPEMAMGYDVLTQTLHTEAVKPAPVVVSAVGAGDAFATTILYGAYNAWPLAKAMQAAVIVAAYSLASSDASGAIEPFATIMASQTN
ncbi:MAG: carbohydrate kinase family protein [Lactobacillaceae bacterium]|nr:carbohydrate kinase family protein [Lactobacillaceae bacterium]